MTNKELLLATIQERRNELGFSQTEIAEKLGISQGQYARLESGKSEISLEKLISLCDLLEMEIDIRKKEQEENKKTLPILKNLGIIMQQIKDL
jgi:transcriptional regulator with XRE-family HTH domain